MPKRPEGPPMENGGKKKDSPEKPRLHLPSDERLARGLKKIMEPQRDVLSHFPPEMMEGLEGLAKELAKIDEIKVSSPEEAFKILRGFLESEKYLALKRVYYDRDEEPVKEEI